MMADEFADWFFRVATVDRIWSASAAAYVDEAPRDIHVSTVPDEAALTEMLRLAGLRGPLVQAEDVVAERERRFTLGFDHDFGDGRGVHRIGTTAADMKGWDEVTSFANAFVALGDVQTKIEISTDTGPAEVTGLEWQLVLVSAALSRQPIWQASFRLQAMDPIPKDFTDDRYWQGAK